MSSSSTASSNNYVQSYLPPDVITKLEAGAFRSLRQHLEERSDRVANMDLMTISGFCRNCLAKWMVLEARKLVQEEDSSISDDPSTTQALNALGYDEAAQYVYGMDYKDWKKRYQTKATDEQMKRYKESEPLHAKHDRELLLSKADKPNVALYGGEVKEGGVTSSRTSLLSNVCCQDVEGDSQTASGAAVAAQTPVVASETKTSSLTAFVPPAPPSTDMSFRMAILTISDRASQDLYETGDLSGPAVEEQALKVCQSVGVKCIIVEKSIVADEVADIQTTLKQWCSSNDDRRPIDLIFTTGGTGFGPRDVTPEATREILDRECPGLMTFVTTECSQQQPLASLSRGTAGVAGHSLIVNLPGNPKGVGEIMPILLPVILHAVHDLQRSNSGTVEGLE